MQPFCFKGEFYQSEPVLVMIINKKLTANYNQWKMVGAVDPTACSFNRSGSYVTPDSPCYLTPQLVGSHVIRCSGYSCTRWDYAYCNIIYNLWFSVLHFKIVHVGSTYYVRLFQNGEKDAVALVRLVASSLR